MLVSSCCRRAVGGHVEFGEHLLADDAGLAEAVAGLEALDRRLDEGIVDGARARDRIEVARGDEPVAQRLHARPLRADLQFAARRHAVPAAPGDDVLIFLDRRLCRLDRGRRQDRRRLAPDRQLGRGFVALRPFRLVVAACRPTPRKAQCSRGRKRRARPRRETRGARAAKQSCRASSSNSPEIFDPAGRRAAPHALNRRIHQAAKG